MVEKLTDTQQALKELILKHNLSDLKANPNNKTLRGDITYLGTLFMDKVPNITLKARLGEKIEILTLTVDSRVQSEMLGDIIKFYEQIDINKNTQEDLDKENGFS